MKNKTSILLILKFLSLTIFIYNYLGVTSLWGQMSDPYRQFQWALDFLQLEQNQTVLPRISVIALIDTGVDLQHPDLKNQIWKNDLECNSDGSIPTRFELADKDGNGYVSDCMGWNFATINKSVDRSQVPSDKDGHGTHLAGILSAESSNGVGIAGLSSQIKILPIKVMNSSSNPSASLTVYNSDSPEGRLYSQSELIAEGIEYALKRKVDVISLSLNWTNRVQTERLSRAFEKAKQLNIPIITSAGNEGSDKVPFPCNEPDIICVGSLAKNGNISNFSNYGGEVDLYAPGEDILSTWPRSLLQQNFVAMGYDIHSGTSQAVPFVAMSMAKWKALHENFSFDQLHFGFLNAAKNKMLSKDENEYYYIQAKNISEVLVKEQNQISIPLKLFAQVKTAQEVDLTLTLSVTNFSQQVSLLENHQTITLTPDRSVYNNNYDFSLPNHIVNNATLSWKLKKDPDFIKTNDTTSLTLTSGSRNLQLVTRWDSINKTAKEIMLDKNTGLFSKVGGRKVSSLIAIPLSDSQINSGYWFVVQEQKSGDTAKTRIFLLKESDTQLNLIQDWTFSNARRLVDYKIWGTDLYLIIEAINDDKKSLRHDFYKFSLNLEDTSSTVEHQTFPELLYQYQMEFLVQDNKFIDAINKRANPLIFTTDNIAGFSNIDKNIYPLYLISNDSALTPSLQRNLNPWKKDFTSFKEQLFLLYYNNTSIDKSTHLISLLARTQEEKLRNLLHLNPLDHWLNITPINWTSAQLVSPTAKYNQVSFIVTYGNGLLQKTAIISYDILLDSFSIIKTLSTEYQPTPMWQDGQTLSPLWSNYLALNNFNIYSEQNLAWSTLDDSNSITTKLLPVSSSLFYPLHVVATENSQNLTIIDKNNISLYQVNPNSEIRQFSLPWKKYYGLDWPKAMKNFLQPTLVGLGHETNTASNKNLSPEIKNEYSLCWIGQYATEISFQCAVPNYFVEHSHDFILPLQLTVEIPANCASLPFSKYSSNNYSQAQFVCLENQKFFLTSIDLTLP